MKLCPRSVTLSALTLGLALCATSARADLFDWNNVTYAPATTSAGAAKTTLTNSALTSNTLSLQIDLVNGATFLTTVASPVAGSNTTNTNNADNRFSTSYAVGGQATTQKALQLGANFGDNTQYMLVTIFFAKPVTSVTLPFFDIDVPQTTATTQYVDQLRGFAASNSNTGATVPLTTLSNTDSTYTTVNGTTSVMGKLANAQTDGNANATATWTSTTAFNQVSFVYGDAYTGTTTHANGQLTALGNISFTNAVPEPGTTAMMALGVFGAAGVAFRRRRSK